MFLAHALNVSEDSVICDLAETYGIFNYRGLPCSLVATLVCGLRDDSRIMMKLSNSEIDVNRLLMASMLDQLNFLAWAKTKNAQRGTNKPKSVVASLLDTKKDFVAFDSVEEFERARDMILNRKE